MGAVSIKVDPNDADCIVFGEPETASITGVKSDTGVDFYAATGSTTKAYGATAAASTQVANKIGTTAILPAKSAGQVHAARVVTSTVTFNSATGSSTSIYGAENAPSGQVFHEAVAAPNDQTLVPAVANGQITPLYIASTLDDVAIAGVAGAKTIVTGLSNTGSDIVTGITESSTTKQVTVGVTGVPIVSK